MKSLVSGVVDSQLLKWTSIIAIINPRTHHNTPLMNKRGL